MSFFLVLAAAGVLLYHFYRHVLTPLLFSSLRTLPCAHPIARFSPAWISWQRRRGREIRSIFAAHQRCGPIVLIGPSEVSVASLDGLRQIYTGGFDKDPWYTFFINYNTQNMVSMLDFHAHSAQKKILSHLYSKSYLFKSADLEKVTRKILLGRLLPVIDGEAERGSDVDVFELTKAVGMDFTAAYVWGLSVGTDLIRNRAAREHVLHLFHVKTRNLPGHVKASLELEDQFMLVCRAALDLDQRLSGMEKVPDDISRPVVFSKLYNDLCRLQRMPPEKAIVQAASEMFDHVLAGLDTTGITLTYLMYELSQRPELQKALRSELQSLSGTFSLTQSNASNIPKAGELDTLPLLNAITQETLRLYSAAPAPQPRLVPKGGATIDGHVIPAGVRVSTAAYCMHRSEDAFPDPLSFKPERWLAGEKGAHGSEKMRRWFWAFGSGGRMCVGSNFAIHMLKSVTAAVYANFNTVVVDAEGIEQRDAYIAGPMGNKLILKFERIDPDIGGKR